MKSFNYLSMDLAIKASRLMGLIGKGSYYRRHIEFAQA